MRIELLTLEDKDRITEIANLYLKIFKTKYEDKVIKKIYKK